MSERHSTGASSAPAAIGSIASAMNGMPTIAKPPPNAPFMDVIRKTAKATTASAIGSSGSDAIALLGKRSIRPDTNDVLVHRGLHGTELETRYHLLVVRRFGRDRTRG